MFKYKTNFISRMTSFHSKMHAIYSLRLTLVVITLGFSSSLKRFPFRGNYRGNYCLSISEIQINSNMEA